MVPTTRICRVGGAKLNLALHVRRKRSDGYHDIDSVFVHAVDGDELWFEPASDLSLTITGPFADGLSDGEDNLVMRAARGVEARFARTSSLSGSSGAAITLVKSLPIASGIGGGSADAAATIAALVALWDLPVDRDRMNDVAASLGADVAPCLTSWPKRVTGRGEDYAIIDDRAYPAWPVLLVNPLVPLATAAVFAGWDGVDRGGIADPSFAAICADGRNDLTAAATAQVPVIADVLAALGQTGARVARMSGSGATCFALYDSSAARDAARTHVERAEPGWWTMATRLR